MTKYYLTTPIYYINGLPHIGHIFTTVLSDAVARYHRLLGHDVFFLTGTDEHGQKAQKAAQELGITPREVADLYAPPFQQLWRLLRISHSDFIRTTERRHYASVQEAFRRAQANNDIYLGAYEGWYCTFDEAFWTEGQLIEGNCPDCGRKAESISEESYFFRLSKYQQPLLDFYQKHPSFVVPRSRFNEVIRFVESGLRDLSVSRLKLKWGIPVPGDPKHVIYVWYDALSNYITGVGFPTNQELFQKYWPADLHVIGKDILRFHAVYWPAFLMSAGISLPRQILAHGWWLNEDEKISKSRGNVVEPSFLINRFGVDGLRYFLVREAPLETDSNYSQATILRRVNSDLANDLGNLVSRALTMVQRYCDSSIPSPAAASRVPFRDALERMMASLDEAVTEFAFPRLLAEIWEAISGINRYIVEQEPWNLAKDSAAREKLQGVLYNTCEAIRVIAGLIAPVMPDSADKIWNQLGIRQPASAATLHDLKWGGLISGSRLGELSAVFPRIDEKESSPSLENSTEIPESTHATIEDFQKLGLKVGEIKSAERIQGSKKLLKLTVDLGFEIRSVVAGIAEAYSVEELVGRQVIVVTNLKPARLMGVESNGMILAASVEGKPILATILASVPNGTNVK